jgi:hypothetical protein
MSVSNTLKSWLRLGFVLTLLRPAFALDPFEDLPGAGPGVAVPAPPARPSPAPPASPGVLASFGAGFLSVPGNVLHAVTHPGTIPGSIGNWFGQFKTAYQAGDHATLARMAGQVTFGAVTAALTTYLIYRFRVPRAERAFVAGLPLDAKNLSSTLKASKLALAPSTKAVRLPPLKVDSLYHGENAGKVLGGKPWNVNYLKEAERARYQLTIRNGKIYDARGQLYDTRTANTMNSRPRSLFVLDESGNFYASKRYVKTQFHHSTLGPDRAGRPVLAAGELEVHKGVLRVFSDRSGHYLPSANHSAEALLRLRDAGVDMRRVFVQLDKAGYWKDFLRYLTTRALP